MVKSSGIGEAEMELVHFISKKGSIRVKEAVEDFGNPRNLARTTVVTMLDRLRKKGVLQRSKSGKFYVYALKESLGQTLKDSMRRFFRRTLGGSLSPWVAYLSEETEYTDEDIQELKMLVEELEQRKNRKKSES